jgi:hypothetical protein
MKEAEQAFPPMQETGLAPEKHPATAEGQQATPVRRSAETFQTRVNRELAPAATAEEREARQKRAEERFRRKVVATREEVEARLITRGRAPLTEDEWQKALRESALSDSMAEGSYEQNESLWLQDIAERKKEWERWFALSDAEKQEAGKQSQETARRCGRSKTSPP